MLVLGAALGACASDGGRELPRFPRRVPPAHDGALVTYWADDRVREEGTYREGRRHGEVRGYHPDGSLAFEGEFRDGRAAGELRQYAPGGVLAVTHRAGDGVEQGERLQHWPDGTLRERLVLSGGRRNGPVERWHADGTPELRGQYADDAPVGEWQAFDAQGRLVASTVYWTAAGQPAGYLETIHEPDGRIPVQTRMLLRDGDWLGRVTLWYPDGVQAGLVEYRNGKREGLDIAWDASGRKRSEGRRVADLREGVWTAWDEQGRVEGRVLYEADRALGPAPDDAGG